MKKNKNKNKPEPVLIKSQTLGEMFQEIANAPEPKPFTRKEKKEVDELLRQLAESQGPGDALMVVGIPRKKK